MWIFPVFLCFKQIESLVPLGLVLIPKQNKLNKHSSAILKKYPLFIEKKKSKTSLI